ncbi:cupin domain-containing protein [Rhizobium sp. 2YAF20]|uniref:cupin domain-containing protein n=1 Tax=Rhizobium sp. 2YAF20 TaxID=3233027 RepID=UPI003F94C056
METIRLGGIELEFLQSKDETGGSLDIFKMTVQPKAKVPIPHYHDTWDETICGLSGTILFHIDGRDVAIGPGQSAFIRRGVVHHFSNETEAPTTCLCVLTPGVLGPGYFREIAVLLTGGPPDPAAMKAVMLRHGLVPAVGVP